MKRMFSVIALGVALGLSTMGFRNAETGTSVECDATSDLTVTAALENAEVGEGEIKGKIVNQSTDTDYDEVMVRVEFHGSDLGTSDLTSDPNMSTESEFDVEVEDDMDVDVDAETDMDRDADLDGELDSETEIESDANYGSLETDSRPLGAQVFTITEDVEAGEVEEFELDITPPAGTTKITTSVVCAD